jgi:AcrR family transcriptional regulator
MTAQSFGRSNESRGDFLMTSDSDADFTSPAITAAADGQQDKRNRIIERAIIMFNQFGYDRVRISDITDSLNIGKGTFYLYFKNKKDLLLKCFDRLGEFIQELESLPDIQQGDFFSKVGPRVESIGHFDWFRGLVNLLRAAELSPDWEIKAKAREAYESIARPLKRDLLTAMKEGRVRDVDPDLAVYGFIGMAENVWFRSRLDSKYTPEAVIAYMVDATEASLAAGRERAGAEAQSTLVTTVHLICTDGAAFDLDHVRYDGAVTLRGVVGQAQIDIDPSKIANLEITNAGGDCAADLNAVDGTTMQLRVAGDLVVSGRTSMGTVCVAMRDISTLAPVESSTTDPGGLQ